MVTFQYIFLNLQLCTADLPDAPVPLSDAACIIRFGERSDEADRPPGRITEAPWIHSERLQARLSG